MRICLRVHFTVTVFFLVNSLDVPELKNFGDINIYFFSYSDKVNNV